MIAVGFNILLYADREDSAWRLAVFSCLMRETSEVAPGFFRLKAFWPAPRSMQYAQNFEVLSAYPIGNDVR